MKSNVCRIDKSTKDLAAILKESERVAEYNGLTHKQALQLRLLCEEIDGMLPNIIEDFVGNLWIEYDGDVCKINVSIEIPKFDIEKKEELIAISNSKKNAAAVGIVGKIRNAIENFFLNEDSAAAFNIPTEAFCSASGYCEGIDYAYQWRLEQYRLSVNKEDDSREYDELEKSVIASVADDVIVGVKGNKADIVIIKKFAQGEDK